MKKRTLLNLIGEGVDKTYLTNMNEDSYYDGHKFVEYGKNIDNVSLILRSQDENVEYSINKERMRVDWGLKFEFRNFGVDGVQISILGMTADLITTTYSEVGHDDEQETPINFAEYRFNVIKEKNVENNDLQMVITSVEVDAEQKIVNVAISI